MLSAGQLIVEEKQEKKKETIQTVLFELELDGVHLLTHNDFRAAHLREALSKVMKEEHNEENLVFLVTLEDIYEQYKDNELAAHAEIDLVLRDAVKKFVAGDTPTVNLPYSVFTPLLEKYNKTQELTFSDLLPAVKEIKSLVTSDVITRCQARVLAADCERTRKELMQHKDNILAALSSYEAFITEDKQRSRYHSSASLRKSLEAAHQMKAALDHLDEKATPEKLEEEIVKICNEHAVKQNNLYQEFKEKEMNQHDSAKADYAMHKAERVSSLLDVIKSYGIRDESHVSFFSKIRRYSVSAPALILKNFCDYAAAAIGYLKYIDTALLNAKTNKITAEAAQNRIVSAEKMIHSFMQKDFLQQRMKHFLTGMAHYFGKDEVPELNKKIMAASKLAKKVSEGMQEMYSGVLSGENLALVKERARDIQLAFSKVSEQIDEHVNKKESAQVAVMGKQSV